MAIKDVKDIREYTIDLIEAQTRIAAWQADQRQILKIPGLPGGVDYAPLYIKAFTFSTDDLLQLCEKIYSYNYPKANPVTLTGSDREDPVDGIRFYIGRKSVEGTDEVETCLIAVPVLGFDGEEGRGGGDAASLWDSREVATIYDFSYPCPATCAAQGQSIMDGYKFDPLKKTSSIHARNNT